MKELLHFQYYATRTGGQFIRTWCHSKIQNWGGIQNKSHVTTMTEINISSTWKIYNSTKGSRTERIDGQTS